MLHICTLKQCQLNNGNVFFSSIFYQHLKFKIQQLQLFHASIIHSSSKYSYPKTTYKKRNPKTKADFFLSFKIIAFSASVALVLSYFLCLPLLSKKEPKQGHNRKSTEAN